MITTSSRTEKPWGHELLWARSSRYAGKILFIKKGHRLSRQYHNTKEETIMVLDGQLVCEEGPSKENSEIIRHVMDPGRPFMSLQAPCIVFALSQVMCASLK